METRTCAECAGPLPEGCTARRKYCDDTDCKRAVATRIQREWQAKYREKHGRSSTRKYDHLPEYKAKKAIREERRHAEMTGRERYPAYYAAKDYRRRALIKERTVEEFDPAEVYERDGWICQLCREPVDPELKYDPKNVDTRCKSLDHVVPLARGGEHSRENTQLAHLGCNIRKRDRIVERGDPDGRQAQRTDRPQDSREAPLGVDH